jgi:hypothetical protein
MGPRAPPRSAGAARVGSESSGRAAAADAHYGALVRPQLSFPRPCGRKKIPVSSSSSTAVRNKDVQS